MFCFSLNFYLLTIIGDWNLFQYVNLMKTQTYGNKFPSPKYIMNKQYLRNYFGKVRKKSSVRKSKKYSKIICKKLAFYLSDKFPENSHFLIYYPLLGEVNIFFLINLLPQMSFYFPRILAKKQMDAILFQSFDDLVPHKFSTKIPTDCSKVIKADNLQAIIVPGLSFSLDGARLGFGGGYYDRYFCQTSALKIGICFKNLISKESTIPMNKHDFFMDLIVYQ
ncbi:MAG: 5-formyltetrahydrofolate cyclo-ligase [Candidatus Cloacimonadota bacterium]|nr:MAG: 5-formyltetrahydrofolate cyclo-ligase [Candidatus Cloacimonadota bacterium]